MLGGLGGCRGTILHLMLHQRHGYRLSLRLAACLGPCSLASKEVPDLAEQGDLLVVGFDPALETIEQVQQPAPIVWHPQELWKRRERLHWLELDDVRLLADDLAGGLGRHVDQANILANEVPCPFQGREPPPPG